MSRVLQPVDNTVAKSFKFMKLIPVGNSHAQVDDSMYESLSVHRWILNNGYAVARVERGFHKLKRFVHMHWLVLSHRDGYQIDHIDRNKLNNCVSNLRYVTAAQNQWNTGTPRTNTSGHKGVSFYKRTGQWQAGICVKGKRISLGLHATKEAASQAYQDACKQYHKF